MTQAVLAATLLLASVAAPRVLLAAEGSQGSPSAPPYWTGGHSTARGLSGTVNPSDVDATADGVYGRFDGDLTGALGLGAVQAFSGAPLQGSLRGSLHYYWSVGLYARYADSLKSARPGEARRSFGSGVELRPAFLVRWQLNLEQGPAWLDLLTDSAHASIGPVWVESQEGERAAAAELGFGLGFPLMLSAAGLWLEIRTALPLGKTNAESTLGVALAWHGLFTSPWQDR